MCKLDWYTVNVLILYMIWYIIWYDSLCDFAHDALKVATVYKQNCLDYYQQFDMVIIVFFIKILLKSIFKIHQGHFSVTFNSVSIDCYASLQHHMYRHRYIHKGLHTGIYTSIHIQLHRILYTEINCCTSHRDRYLHSIFRECFSIFFFCVELFVMQMLELKSCINCALPSCDLRCNVH